MRPFWGEYREARVFLWGGGVPPHDSDLERGLSWGLSVPGPLLFLLFGILYQILLRRCLLSLSGRVAVPSSARCSVGEGVIPSAALPFPSPPSPPVSVPSTSPPSSAAPSPVPLDTLGLSWRCQSLATLWAAPWQEVNYSGHEDPGLLFGRPPPP